MANAMTATVVDKGTVNVTFNNVGGMAYAYAFQQTAGDTSVTISNPTTMPKGSTIKGLPNTGGKLTFLPNMYALIALEKDAVYTIKLTSWNGLIDQNKILTSVVDTEVGNTAYSSTCVITCEDSSDNDYNDLTLIITWYKHKEI